MGYTNSPLVSHTHISPNRNSPRNHAIDTISIHCGVGQCTVETLGNIFAPTSKGASSNYGVGYDGKIGMYVEERDRSWCTSSAENDNRAVTIETASDTFEPYAVKPAAYEALIKLCADICKRNGKTRMTWIPDKAKALAYNPAPDEMRMTVHRWFDSKSCPGTYLMERQGEIARRVTELLGGEPAKEPEPETAQPEPKPQENHLYRVRKSWAERGSQVGAFNQLENAKKCADEHPGYSVFDETGASVYKPSEGFKEYRVRRSCVDPLNIRLKPTVQSKIVGQIADRNIYTIVDEIPGDGSKKGWGKLKSGLGWIALDWVDRVG